MMGVARGLFANFTCGGSGLLSNPHEPAVATASFDNVGRYQLDVQPTAIKLPKAM